MLPRLLRRFRKIEYEKSSLTQEIPLEFKNKTIIHFSQVTVSYQQSLALEEINLEIPTGEFLGIIGPNGSGKTTLLKTILGLITPIQGTVHIFDCSCEKLRCHHRARIGYLPQKGFVNPDFPITVQETVMMGRYGSIGLLKHIQKKDHEIVQEALEAVGLVDQLDIPLGYLSGGQQQRVFIARTLAQKPEVLLLDEPTTGIDAHTQHSLMGLIKKLHKNLGLTILMVTHDINLISPHVDRMAILNHRLFAIGKPREILTQETLSKVYGKETIIMERPGGSLVIVGDHHHA